MRRRCRARARSCWPRAVSPSPGAFPARAACALSPRRDRRSLFPRRKRGFEHARLERVEGHTTEPSSTPMPRRRAHIVGRDTRRNGQDVASLGAHESRNHCIGSISNPGRPEPSTSSAAPSTSRRRTGCFSAFPGAEALQLRARSTPRQRVRRAGCRAGSRSPSSSPTTARASSRAGEAQRRRPFARPGLR